MSRVTPVRYFRQLLATRPIGDGKENVFYSGRPSFIVLKIFQDSRDAFEFWKTLLIRKFADYLPAFPSSTSPSAGPRSDGFHHPSLSIVTAPRFNGRRSNLASNFGPGFKTGLKGTSALVRMGHRVERHFHGEFRTVFHNTTSIGPTVTMRLTD